MKSTSGLLKRALLKTKDLTLDVNGYVHYKTKVWPNNRLLSLSNVFDSFEAADRFAGNQITEVSLAPAYISVDDYLIDSSSDSVPKYEQINPHYGMPKLCEGYRWDTPYQIDNQEEESEQFSSTFVIHSSQNKVQGTFVFALSLTRNADGIFFRLDLPLVYVRPQFRNGTFGLDLTIAVARLATELYANIILSYRGKIPIDVIIYADFESKSGERLGNLVVDEFRDTFQLLTDSNPKISHKLGEIFAEMG